MLASLLCLFWAFLTVAGGHVSHKRQASNNHWIDTWASMPQLTETSNLPPAPFTQSTVVFANSTVRQTVHLSLGGTSFRIRISNAFGTTNLPITAVSVALPTNGSAGVSSIQPNTLHAVTFSGQSSFDIPNGALVVSDPITLPSALPPQSMLTVTIYLAQGQQSNNITSHPGSRTTTWMVQGNQLNATNITGASVQSVAHWYFLSTVEVWAPVASRTFAIVGDSITDGRGSTDNANNRWPDLVLRKMQNNTSTSNIAVVNQAAGGNRILADGLGPNAIGRIDRDVLSHSGIHFAMIFEGVNDIGVAATTAAAQQAIGDQLITAFKQIATRIHALGIPIFAATITPFGAPSPAQQAYSDPTREKTRQRVNAFIKDSGTFDAVIDFDAILRDPNQPDRLADEFDSGDFLHPNVAGYQALADAFPLDIFDEFEGGVGGFE